MEQTPKRNFLTQAAIYGISFLCVVGATSLGAALRAYIPFGGAGLIASLCLLAVLILLSLTGHLLLKHRMNAANVHSVNEYVDQHRGYTPERARQGKRSLDLACALVSLYVILLALSLLFVCFFCGVLDISITSAPVVCMFLFYGLVARLFQKREKPDHSKALPEEAYPQLYGLVREVAGLKQGRPVYIFLGSPEPEEMCNASISQQGGNIYLLLGPALLCVLTEAELRQILRHEFAHIDLEHTRELTRFDRVMRYLDGGDTSGLFQVWTNFILRFPAAWLLLKGQFYFLFSSAVKERMADDLAADPANARIQASALAKTQVYSLFDYEERSYVNLYRSETVPTDFTTSLIRRFRQKLPSRADFWRQLLERELPSRVASHPTFRQRWDALGNCPYDLTPAPETGAFARECWAAAVESDRRMAQLGEDRYQQLRQQNYLQHLQTVQAYEEDPAPRTPEEMRPVILGYYHLGMPEQAEALCDRLIAENDSPFATAFARYWKGVILLLRYDKAGLEPLYAAIEANRNYTDEGLELIGRFCTMMGLEQELNDYRSRAADYLQKSVDYSAGGIHRKANLCAEQLPDDWQEQILAYILKNANGHIRQVYLVHEIVSDVYRPSSFILRYREDTSEDEQERIYEAVFRLLDDWPTDWEFCLYDYEPSMEKPLEKVPGCCIYNGEQP